MSAEADSIASVIQLAVAPVFLLTGIAGMLGVTANRLTRIVDRARTVEPIALVAQGSEREHLDQEIATLARRARLIYRAIALLVIAALLVCAVIVGLFVTAHYAWTPDLTRLLAALFAAALLALIFGLLTFLREVYLATQNLRIGHPH
jgi:hypothetical protein